MPDNVFDMLGSQLLFLSGNVSTGLSSGALGTSIRSSDIPLMLYEANNVTRAMKNLAQHMTTEIRAIDPDILQQKQRNASVIASQQVIVGNVLAQKQFITVEWAWLTLPIVLLVSATFLLLAVFSKTKNNRVGLWQSSPLTLFFHGQQSGEIKAFGPNELDTADKMLNAAAGLQQRIRRALKGCLKCIRMLIITKDDVQ